MMSAIFIFCFGHCPGNVCYYLSQLDCGSLADWVNIFVVILLGVLVSYYEHERTKESEQVTKNLSKPIITFQIVTTKIIDKENHAEAVKEFYKIFNYGKGAAINLTAAYKNGGDNEWQKPVKCYSLGENGGMILCWNPKLTGEQWIVKYSDVFQREFYTICKDDGIRVIERNNYKTQNDRNDCEMFETFLERSKNSIRRLWEIEKDDENYCRELKDKDYR